MEHSDLYADIKKRIQDGKYKKNMKQLAKKLMKLREIDGITQEEHNDLMKLNSEIIAKPK